LQKPRKRFGDSPRHAAVFLTDGLEQALNGGMLESVPEAPEGRESVAPGVSRGRATRGFPPAPEQ
jgi:hypothetical protein